MATSVIDYGLTFLTGDRKRRKYILDKKIAPIPGWRKRIQQDAYVGLAIIFLTMGSCFLWVIFFYFKIFS